MTTSSFRLGILWLASCVIALGQGSQLPKYTVATLPSASTQPTYTVQVIDGISASDCTVGGGYFNVICVVNGGIWQSAGGGPAFSGVGQPLYVPSGLTPQYNAATATTDCWADATTGQLVIVPVNQGAGYITPPTVTITGLPAGTTASATANLTFGAVTSYTVTSSGWTQAAPNPGCPAHIAVSAPPTPTTPVAVINAANGATAVQPVIRVDDFGAAGDGVTDDTIAINNALAYAGTHGNSAVAFTAGKTYYVNTITGYVSGGGDNGVVPIAGTATCTVDGSGVPVPGGCTITSNGYGLSNGSNGTKNMATDTTFRTVVTSSGTGVTVTPTLTACDIGHCPNGNYGYYLSGLTASGGTGYPVSGTYNVLIGDTCAGAVCTIQAPNYSQVGYALNVPDGVVIQGNGATLSGGFTTTAANVATYTNAAPYIIGVNTGRRVTIHDLTMTNFLIGINYGSYFEYDGGSVSGWGCAFTAQGGQFSSFHHIHNGGLAQQCGWFLGGNLADRAPFTGLNQSNIVNSFNLADNLTIDDVEIGLSVYTTAALFNQHRKSLDSWFDANFIHLEDTGITNSDNAYTPVGYTCGASVCRMTDQDIALLPSPDFQWRGVHGMGVVFMSMYGRPLISAKIKNFTWKGDEAYMFNLTSVAGTQIDNTSDEGGGLCYNSISYGDSTCPNPYEPFNIVRPSRALITGSSFRLSFANNSGGTQPSVAPVSLPWNVQRPLNWSNVNFYDFLNISDSSPSGVLAGTPGVAPNMFGYDQYNEVIIHSAGARQGQQMNSNSLMLEGSRWLVTAGNFSKPDFWKMQLNNAAYYSNKSPYERSTVEFSNSLNQSIPNNGYSDVKVPGLVVDPAPMAGGQVTALTIGIVGSGYTPFQHIACSMTPAPQEVSGTTITGTNLTPSTDTWSVGANWTGTTYPFVHSSGSTATVSDTTFTPTIGNYYVVTVVLSSTTAGPITVSLGGSTSVKYGINGTYVFRVLASTTGQLTVTPSTNFVGTVTSITTVNVATSTLYQATCDAKANQTGGVGTVTLVTPALGYVTAPTVTLQSPSSGVTGTATATINTIDQYNGLGHLVSTWTYISAGGSVPAYGSVTITNINCAAGYWGGSLSSPGNDYIIVASKGVTTGADYPLLEAIVTEQGTNNCTMRLRNLSNAAITYTTGPWQFIYLGSKAGSAPPNVVFSDTTASTDTAASTIAPTAPVNGGTGIDSHSLTGIAVITAGVWSALNPAFVAQTDGATVTWAVGGAILANGSLTFTTHGGSRTLNVTGLVNGGSYVLRMTQDATGGEGLTLGTGCTWKVSVGGAGIITPSTSASASDVLAFTYDGTNCYANFNKNFN